MIGEGTADNIIWLHVIKEFVEYVKTVFVFDYVDILDVERTINNISATPKDSKKYYVKCDDNENELNTIYSFDEDGNEIFSYKPVFKDRIIFLDTDKEIPNYIFIYRMLSDDSYDNLTAEELALLVVQREESDKYNNSLLGSKGITEFIGYTQKNLTQTPNINFMYESESKISLYNRRNQPNSEKQFIVNMRLMTSNETLYNNEIAYDRCFEMQKVVGDLWGDYLSFCNSGKYKGRITGIIPYNGQMINEVSYQPAIIQNIQVTIVYR